MNIQSGNIGTQHFEEKQIIAAGHPVMVITWPVKPDNGVYEAGQLLGLDDGEVVAYDQDIPLKGVCMRKVDTAVEAAADIIVHGTVVKAALTVLGAPIDNDDILALHDITVYPI